ncbi:MAG: T9SS type A sorting domain-containing protein [Flavobacteriales bacterium]
MKLLLPILLVCASIIQSNQAQAQFVLNVTVNNTSGPAICDGSASIDSNNINFVSVAWYMNGTLLQNGGTTIYNLCPGTYTVNATGGGITLTSPFTIGSNSPNPCAGFGAYFNSTPTSSQTACDGSITTSVYGGTAPYTYNWNVGGSITNPNPTNLCPGTYAVIITDANGCVFNGSETVIYDTTSTNPCSGFTANITVTDCSAPGACDGAAVVSSTAAPNTFFVSWSQGSTTYGINNLCEGYYYAVVTDTNGCSVSLTEFVGYNGGGTIDTINVIGNIATGGMITGTLMSSWNYNCNIDLSMLDTAYMVSAVFGNNPANQDSLYTVWYLSDTTGAFTYISCTFYAPFATGTYNLVLQVYCPIKSNPIYYHIISQFDVTTASIQSKNPVSLKLSPNPVQEELVLIGQVTSDYKIFDQTGKCLMLGHYNDAINVRELANGTYFIQINNLVLPFIKNAQ